MYCYDIYCVYHGEVIFTLEVFRIVASFVAAEAADFITCCLRC